LPRARLARASDRSEALKDGWPNDDTGEARFHPNGGSVKKTRHPRQSRTELGRVGRIFSPTALGLFLLFTVTTYAGARIVFFERLESRIGSAAKAEQGREAQPVGSKLEAVSSWSGTAGIATRARSLALKILVSETPGDGAAVENALRELAAASPATAATWQALVAFRRARGDPIESVLVPLRMSALTAPHEEYFVKKRAVFGLEYWADLPEADRRMLVRDLVSPIRNYWTDDYRRILAAKSQAVRDEIRTAVIASGRATKDLFTALGI
jgi:hypothetical protein